MTATAWILAAAFATQGAAPYPRCGATDSRCRASANVAQAATATAPDPRAAYLLAASREFFRAFERTGARADLCDARRVLRQAMAIHEVSARLREDLRDDHEHLLEAEPQIAAKCAVTRDSPTPAAPTPRAQPVERTIEDPVLEVQFVDPPTIYHVSPPRARDELLSSSRQQERRRALAPRAPRSLLVAGSLSLGAGIILGAVATHYGRRADGLYRVGVQLHEEAMGSLTPDERSLDQRLSADYYRVLQISVSTAIAGSIAAIVGAALIGAGLHRRKQRRAETSLALSPRSLALIGRF
ncbi:MAG: hypothetical protein IPK80_21100 [Nannocystis sp.]|nr:hypothetical protein [Nannocystis sp.]